MSPDSYTRLMVIFRFFFCLRRKKLGTGGKKNSINIIGDSSTFLFKTSRGERLD